MTQTGRLSWKGLLILAIGVLVFPVFTGAAARGAPQQPTQIGFTMVRSTAAQNGGCLGRAGADVRVVTRGANQVMQVNVRGLPANTGFVLFVIQVPNAPFGMGWYQGDVDTGANGRGSATFIGRFNIETFVVAPGSAPAPRTHRAQPFPDAGSNPATAPVHMYHLGLWFDVANDARRAGCPATVTPFNGDHTAGIQALSTRNFPNGNGPLRRLP
jgi:hypothetical protein